MNRAASTRPTAEALQPPVLSGTAMPSASRYPVVTHWIADSEVCSRAASDMLMTLKRVPDERITAIVDDLFLPLVTGTSRR